MSKALVTGASGFIGSTLIAELDRRGVQAHALLRRSSSVANLEGARYTRVEGDVSDLESLRRAVRGMDVVYHLAGLTAAPSREAFFACNADGCANVARAVAEENPGLRRLVIVSSLAAGGPARSLTPRTERDADEPVSQYGQSKRAGELEALKFSDRIPISIVRPPLVYGPKDKGVFLVIQSVSRGLAPIVSGRGEGGHKYYSAVHSEDLVRGIIAAGQEVSTPSGEIFYITGDGTFRYEELIDAMAQALGKRPFRFRVPPALVKVAAASAEIVGRLTGKSFPLNRDKLGEILPDYWLCSSDKAKTQLGFKPTVGLVEGMAGTVRWYRERGWL